MAETRDWGLALQRMGAGFQGNLPQFDLARAQQEELALEREEKRTAKAQQLSLERQKALAQDAQTVGQFLEMGEVGKAVQLLDNRLALLQQLGGDPSDTQGIRDLIVAGNVDEAAREIKLFTTVAENRGLIKPLVSVDEQIKKDELQLKEAEFKAKYGMSASDMRSGQGGGGGGIEGQKMALERAKAAREAAQFAVEQADIPERWQKPYLDATQKATEVTGRAAELAQLAQDFDSVTDLKAGARATFDETAKRFFGEEDAVSALRQRFKTAVNAQVMNNLPPGVASDRDIELAREGFPTGEASKENILNFLRGNQKILALEAAYEQFKVDYLDQNRTLKGVNQAWRQEAPKAFEAIKSEIGKPLNRSYTTEDYEAEARRRGLVK